MRCEIAILMLAFAAGCSSGEGVYVVPAEITADAYPGHAELRWENSKGFDYVVFRSSTRGGSFEKVGETRTGSFLDFWNAIPEEGTEYIYRILPKGMKPRARGAEEFEVAVTSGMSDDTTLVDMVQRYTTRWFREQAHPQTGMTRERTGDTHGDIVTTGGTGFGIMALVAGVRHDYLTRDDAREQITRIVDFLGSAERFHGAWAHWYDGDTGRPFSFSRWDDGGDLVETAFLMQGLLAARQYFISGSPEEEVLAGRIDTLWRGVEWDWYTRGTDSLYWHWSPNYGWKMNHRIKGFDETLITYVLAASSPTHPISRQVYETSYKTSDYYLNGKDYYGINLALGMEYGGPLFFTHYSFLGLDPRGLCDDSGIDYFDRNRAHALIHRAYAIDNANERNGFGPGAWGFTSSDDPLVGYSSHHPATEAENGTIAPTAALSSIVYTPQESLEAMRHYYFDMGSRLFGPCGFYDAFNLGMTEGQQVVRSYLAIDQGPIAVMAENWRSGLLWELFMSSPEITDGLGKLGFYYEYKP